MDEALERRRRAHRASPGDARAVLAYVAALERAGLVDEALALVKALDYRAARKAVGELAPATVAALANDARADRVLREHARSAMGEKPRGRRRMRLLERDPKQAVAMLPWLVPFLTAQQPALAARALALVAKLTAQGEPQ